MHDDVGVHVHAARVIAGVPVDLDLEWRGESGGDGVRAVGIQDLHAFHTGAHRVAVQVTIDLAQRRRRQVEELHAFHEYTSSGLGSKTLACRTPGKCASDRKSEAIAT